MATLTVETGSVVTGANSYITEAYADTYHDGANAAWAALSSANKIAAIIRATRNLDRGYRWRGYQVSRGTQALEWPRVGVWVPEYDGISSLIRNTYEYPSDEIPTAVKQACAEFALREAAEAGSTLPDIDPTARVKRSRNKAGPVETETEYLDDADLTVAFQTVDRLLTQAGLIDSNSTIEIVRA